MAVASIRILGSFLFDILQFFIKFIKIVMELNTHIFSWFSVRKRFFCFWSLLICLVNSISIQITLKSLKLLQPQGKYVLVLCACWDAHTLLTDSGWPVVLQFLEVFLNCKWLLKNPWNNDFLRIYSWNVLEFYFSSFIKNSTHLFHDLSFWNRCLYIGSSYYFMMLRLFCSWKELICSWNVLELFLNFHFKNCWPPWDCSLEKWRDLSPFWRVKGFLGKEVPHYINWWALSFL